MVGGVRGHTKYEGKLSQEETRICASLGSRMKFKTLCYPVFGLWKT